MKNTKLTIYGIDGKIESRNIDLTSNNFTEKILEILSEIYPKGNSIHNGSQVVVDGILIDIDETPSFPIASVDVICLSDMLVSYWEYEEIEKITRERTGISLYPKK